MAPAERNLIVVSVSSSSFPHTFSKWQREWTSKVQATLCHSPVLNSLMSSTADRIKSQFCSSGTEGFIHNLFPAYLLAFDANSLQVSSGDAELLLDP